MTAPMTTVGEAILAASDRGLTTHSDIAHAARLASKVRRGATLSIVEVGEAGRILERCRSRMIDAGIEPPKVSPQAKRADPGLPSARMAADGRIAVQSPYALKDTVKAIPGARPAKVDGVFTWRFPATPAAAHAVFTALHPHGLQVSPRVRKLLDEHRERDEARSVLDESTPIPDIDTSGVLNPGFELWPHQKRAVTFSAATSASLIAVSMGGGKTLSAIALANHVGAERVVIVCPNKVRPVWPREVAKFSALPWHIVDGTKAKARGGGRVSMSMPDRLAEAESTLFDCRCGARTHAAVINYEALGREPWASWSPQEKVDLAIYDEIHRAKAPTGTVSKNLARWVDFTRRRVGLTGTPLPQTPLDCFGQFRALDPGVFGSRWTTFRARYAEIGHLGAYHVVGYKNQEEMAEKFFSLTYRPTIDLKLPPVTDITREFDLEPKARKIYDSLDSELWADLAALDDGGAAVVTASADQADVDSEQAETSRTVTPANVMVKLLRLQQLTGGTVVDDEGTPARVSTGKADLFEEILDEVGCVKGAPKGPEPVVVFCRFRSDLDAVREVAEKGGLRYAEVSGRRSDGLDDRAEMNPSADVVGVQIQSGGTGVDLTRARVAVWYSLGYSLSDYEQARKRLDRPGQTRPVVMVHLLATSTADADVYEGLASRRSVVDSILVKRGIVNPSNLGYTNSDDQGGREMMSAAGRVPLPFDDLTGRIGAPRKN